MFSFYFISTITLLSANGLIQMYVVALHSYHVGFSIIMMLQIHKHYLVFATLTTHLQISKSLKQQISKTSKIALIGIFYYVHLTFSYYSCNYYGRIVKEETVTFKM